MWAAFFTYRARQAGHPARHKRLSRHTLTSGAGRPGSRHAETAIREPEGRTFSFTLARSIH
ncbi:MAG: hypothetical protein ACLFU4_03160 [Opitutales bacterium]